MRNRRPRGQLSVAIVQEYVPIYRVPFFRELEKLAIKDGVSLTIAAGQKPTGGQKARHDVASDFPVLPVRQREAQIFGRRLTVRWPSAVVRSADLLVFEQARRNLDVYAWLIAPRRGRRVALWGHGVDFTVTKSSSERRLLGAITRRADWFFAYTDRGGRAVEKLGFPSERITVVRNSIDVASAVGELGSLAADDLGLERARLGVNWGHTALFLGGLDSSKRLSVLMQVADRVRQKDRSFHLLIGGEGESRQWVERECARREWCHYLGRLSGRSKAAAFAISDFVLNPGRVGLIAVDSIAYGIPIVTAEWNQHAPEVDYLEPGVTALFCPDDVDRIAAECLDLIQNDEKRARMSEECKSRRVDFSVDKMAENFWFGVREALGLTNDR